MSDDDYDAVLLVSFGGPEKNEDVMPFLRNVTHGRNVPEERLLEVAEHYYHFNGKSPINDQNRSLVAAIRQQLLKHEIELPVYQGNRNWDPYLVDTLTKMRDDGVTKALALVTSAFGSYSGCRQYLQNIEAVREKVGEGAPVIDKLRLFYNHPLFIEAMTERIRAAAESLPDPGHVRIAFTAHSIPCAMAESSPYQKQLEEACRLVAEGLETTHYQLVYQSRSGPPSVPWLEPDILDHIQALSAIGCQQLIIAPIGFISDHMEVKWDLDNEAQGLCQELGIHMVRAGTVGTHPKFVAMIRELIEERLGRAERRRSMGSLGVWPDECPQDCCVYTPRRPSAAPPE